MIVIKISQITKVSLIFVVMSVFGISILTPIAMAPPLPRAEFPTGHYEYYGSCVYGTLNSFRHIDGDVMKWEAELNWYRFYFIFIPTWQLGTTMTFNYPSSHYAGVFLEAKFRWDGGSFNIRITIYYAEGGGEYFTESSTGGTFVFRVYNLDPYMSVYAVNFDCDAPYGSQTFLYIDYLCVGYDPFPY